MTTASNRQSLAGGRLTSEQRLVWHGALPPAAALRDVPALLERSHFRSIERYSLGGIRCRREGSLVACRLLGGPVVLGFADATAGIAIKVEGAGSCEGRPRADAAAGAGEGTRDQPVRVTRQWIILPGWFARGPATEAPAASAYGTLTITLDITADAATAGKVAPREGRHRFEAAIAVEGFPSRFLGLSFGGVPGLRQVGDLVAHCYAAYHAQAGFACLRHVRAVLSGAPTPDLSARDAGRTGVLVGAGEANVVAGGGSAVRAAVAAENVGAMMSVGRAMADRAVGAPHQEGVRGGE